MSSRWFATLLVMVTACGDGTSTADSERAERHALAARMQDGMAASGSRVRFSATGIEARTFTITADDCDRRLLIGFTADRDSAETLDRKGFDHVACDGGPEISVPHRDETR